MNFATWITSTGLDSELCGLLYLVLAHSLWQFALVAALAAAVARRWNNATPERIYALYAGALLLGLVGLPITFVVTRLPGESLDMSVLATAPQQRVSTVPNPPPEMQLPMQKAVPLSVASMPPNFSFGRHSGQVSAAQYLLAWAPWVLGIYAGGVAAMTLRLIHGLWLNYRLSAHARPITAGPLLETSQRLARSWSMRVQPALALTERAIVPQVVGLWRPAILLPTAVLTGLRPDELEMILAHELAHVRRYDLWANLVQRVTEALLFFNPAVWYLSRRISTSREYCCDETTCRLAQSHADDTRVRYAQALLRAVELTQRAPKVQELAALAASGDRPSELRRRVARLFGEPMREPVRITRTGLVTIAAGIAVLLMIPLARQNAAEPESKAKPAKEPAKPTIEVVAIGTHAEEPQRWWDAEGNVLESVPFTWKKEPGGVTTGQRMWRRVVIRINRQIKNSREDRVWEIVGARGSAGGTVEFTEAFEPGTYLSRYFSLSDGTQSFDLRVGVAAGEWETIAEASGVSAVSSAGRSVMFSEPISTPASIDVVVSHNVMNQAYRVIAVDKTGKVCESARSGGSSAGSIVQTRASFPGLTQGDLDHFELQMRRYQWTELNDLPVEPGARVAKVNRNDESKSTESAEIAAMRELVDSYEGLYQRSKSLSEVGTSGGEPTAVASAQLHMSTARAELARLQGKREDVVAQLEAGVAAADDLINALRAQYDSGRTTLDKVLEATALRAETKIKLAQARRDAASGMSSANAEAVPDKKTQWVSKLRRLGEHNQTAFAVGPLMIFELPPDEAWEVVRIVWPEIKVDEVKTGLLKTFEFARHDRVLDVLDLGAADDSPFVRDYAYSYLQNYALRDFKSEEHDYRKWRLEFAGKPVEEVLAANCRWFVEWLREQPPITDPMAWQEMEMMLDLSGSKSSYPSKAEYLRQAGLPGVLKAWLDKPQLDEKAKRDITKFLGSLDKVFDETSSYENADLSGRSLARLTLQGNVNELFMGADLSNVDLSEATIVGGIKSFYETNFSGANLTGAQLIGQAAFQKANLEGAKLEHTLLQGGVAGLQIASFDEAEIKNSRLIGSLQLATFRNAKLVDSRLEGRGPSSQMSNFDGATLERTELINASFQGVSLNNTKFIDCDLSTLRANDLKSCKFDAQTPPRYDAKTKFPEGFDPEDNGWKVIE